MSLRSDVIAYQIIVDILIIISELRAYIIVRNCAHIFGRWREILDKRASQQTL